MLKINGKNTVSRFQQAWTKYWKEQKHALITGIIAGIIATVVGSLILDKITNQKNSQNADSSNHRYDIAGINETDNEYYFSMPIVDFINTLKEDDASNFQYGYKTIQTTKNVLKPDGVLGEQTSFEFIQSYSDIIRYSGESPIVVVPEYVNENKIKTIGDDAFNSNMRTAFQPLQLVVLCDGISSIGNKAFAWNYDLQYVVIPSTVKEISETAFDDCPNVILLLRNNAYALNYCKLNNLKYREI